MEDIKRKAVRKTLKHAKAVIHPRTDHEELKVDLPEIVPIKLSYKKYSEPIGNGRFGIVFCAKILDIVAKDPRPKSLLQTDYLVAVKSTVLKSKHPKELVILQKLNHHNVVKLLMYHKTDKELHFFFEKMACTLLQRLETSGPFGLEEALWLALQLFRALDYLEEASIIHRDIKPSNILLNETCRQLKVCDFGCATQLMVADETAEHHRKFSTYMCSRFYRAPELILGNDNYDFKIDIWSAGCVVAEMLTARPLFRGENAVDQLVEIVSILGPMSADDIACMKIPDDGFCSAFADLITEQNLAKSLPTLADRLRVQMGIHVDPSVLQLLQNIFKYIPSDRWNSEQIISYIEWNA